MLLKLHKDYLWWGSPEPIHFHPVFNNFTQVLTSLKEVINQSNQKWSLLAEQENTINISYSPLKSHFCRNEKQGSLSGICWLFMRAAQQLNSEFGSLLWRLIYDKSNVELNTRHAPVEGGLLILKCHIMAVFKLRTHYPSGRTWANIL